MTDSQQNDRYDANNWQCVDFFSGLGGFSAAFDDAGHWDVTSVEINEEFEPDICADVLDLRPQDIFDAIGYEREEIDALVVQASPPCNVFSLAQPHTENWNLETHAPISDAARESVALVFHTIGLIRALAPDYWFLENPTGRLRWYLGEPTGRVTYCQYGMNYQKPTDLWGNHPPMTYKQCTRGSRCHERNTHGGSANTADPYPRDPAERALVPYELSLAIRDAVEEAITNPPPEQSTLGEVTPRA